MVQLVTLGTNVTPHLHGYYTTFSVKMANKFHQQAEGILLSCLQHMCSPSLNSTSWLQTKRNPLDRVQHTSSQAFYQTFAWLKHSIQMSPCVSSIEGL